MPKGRPTKYRSEFDQQVYKLSLLGATDEEVADFLGVCIDTIFEWAKVHPLFSEARARGKLGADAHVAERLFSRATGHRHDAVKILQYEGKPVIVPYIEVYPPDTQAASWWLKNRQPLKWRDRHEVTGADGGPIVIQPIKYGDAESD